MKRDMVLPLTSGVVGKIALSMLFSVEKPHVFLYDRCILGELFKGSPIFKGNTEQVQLDVISKFCGTPTLANWPDVYKLPQWSSFKPRKIYKRAMREQFP